MKKKLIIYLIAIVTIINLSSLATIIYLKWKQDRAFNMHGVSTDDEMRTRRFQQMKEALNLTSAQVKEFENIRVEFHSHLDSLDKQAHNLRQKMMEEIWKENYDSTKVDDLLSSFGALQNETQRWVVQHLIKFKNVLTPEQAEKFYALISKRFIEMHGSPGSLQMPFNQGDNR